MKKIFAIILVFAVFASCKKLEDLNKNTKDPSTASPESLFTGAQKRLFDHMVTTNVNENIWRLVLQYWNETTYTEEANYDINKRSISDGHWDRLYVRVLKNLNDAKNTLTASTVPDPNKANKLAIIDVMSVYAWSILVETFGDIPYAGALNTNLHSEALNINVLLPKYDNGKLIYEDLVNRLSADIANMDPSGSGFLTADNMYGSNSEGDVTCWLKFANSLKLKMGLNLADCDQAFSVTAVNEATADLTLLINDNSENAKLVYQSGAPNDNPMYEDQPASYRHDFVAGKTIVDTMNNWNDPRRPYYFNHKIDTSSVDTVVKLAYVGAPIGHACSYSHYSHAASAFWQPTAPGLIFDYAEVEFLLAEAAARGIYTVTGASTHYYNGIAASFQYWIGDTTGLAAYIAQSQVAFDAVHWQKSIGLQQWIAYYNRGLEAWTAQRRLDYPVLIPGPNAVSAFPVRFTYPIAEQTLNGANWQAASALITGGDVVTSKLFWDTH